MRLDSNPMLNMSYAPIILFCYQRVDTIRLSIDSLLQCTESKFSDLIIISDGPADDSVKENVERVRKFIRQISGFKSIEIIERSLNLGVDNNIIDGLREISHRFCKFIVLEDDIVVKKNCLAYFNIALEFYQDNEQIISISGFSYLKKIDKKFEYDVYFTGRHNPWGWASWSNRIRDVDWRIDNKNFFLKSSTLQKQFNQWGSDMTSMYIKTIKGKIRAWDIRLDFHIFNKSGYVCYPVESLTCNIGFGRADSTNTIGYNRYKPKLSIDEKKIFKLPQEIAVNENIKMEFVTRHRFSQRAFTKMMNFFRIKN